MKRRTFLKASTLPIWATIETSFLPTIFASSQNQKKHQYIDVSVLNFEEIREKMVLSDYFDQRNIQIIGFGESGRVIVQQLDKDNRDGIHEIRYNQSSGDLEEIVAYEPNRLNTIVPSPLLANVDMEQSESLLNDAMEFDKPDTVFFVGDLESACDFNSISKGFDLARNKGIFTIGVIKVPYGSEQNENTEVGIALSKIEKHFDSLIIIPGDFGPHSTDSVAKKVIEMIINWYLASRPQYSSQFDLSEIKTVLLKGRAEFRDYKIPKKISPIEFVENEIVTDEAISQLKNGLISFHTNENYSYQEMNRVLDLIGKRVDMNGCWCFYCVSEADCFYKSEKPTGISIISTG